MGTGVTRHVRPGARFASRRLVALVLAPALLTGCSAIPGFGSDKSAGAKSTSNAGGPSWLVATRGSATPSPVPSNGRATASPAPTGFLPLAAAAANPTGTPAPSCAPNTFNFSRIAGVDVTPSSGTAVLSWYNEGGSNLVEFRLYAISQDMVAGAQRDVGFVTVRPSATCGRMSGTITNLSPGNGYVFSVDAVVRRLSGNGTYAATVARSKPITTK